MDEQDKTVAAVVASVLKELGVGYKHDPASTVSTWPGAHGPGGIFNDGRFRPDMYSTVPHPLGLHNVIPFIGSVYENERYAILTGVTATEGTRAVDICSEGPTPGRLKVCNQVIPWGTMKIDTTVQRITQFGRRLSYSDLNRNVLNLDAINNPLIPDVLNNNNINTDTGKLLYEAALAIEKSIALLDVRGVNGTVSNAADFNLWVEQFDGLDRWIRTGYTDQPTGVACAAADSAVFTHNAPIASTGTNGSTFIANVVNAVRSVQMRAQRIGMSDFQFAIVMHPNAQWAVYDNWACTYPTDRCVASATQLNYTSANEQVQFRDQMRNGNYLLIDGMNVPVLWSDGMQWDGVSNNVFNTDIFVVPISWRGRPLLYRQYFPLNNSDATNWLNAMPSGGDTRVINNGLYAVGFRTTNGFCSKIEIASRQRLILDTPFLAARINDVQVGYNVSGLDPYVGMSGYRDGGQSSQLYA